LSSLSICLRERAQRGEVLAVDVDRDRRGRAGEDVREAVLDRLADHGGDAGDVASDGGDLLRDRGLVAARRDQSLSISLLLTGSACSSRSARPVRRVTLLTPSIRMSRASIAWAPGGCSRQRRAGRRHQEHRERPSLNSGRNDVPNVRASQSATGTSSPAPLRTRGLLRWRSDQRSDGS
jgi:hypothetical protein